MTIDRHSIPPLIAKPGYRPQAEDTCVESDMLQFYLLRQRTAAEQLKMGLSMILADPRQSLMVNLAPPEMWI